MSLSLNPWITKPASETERPEEAPAADALPAPTITAPLRGMVEPDTADRLGHRPMTGSAAVWVLGTHGGAGESRIADLLDNARATGHCWPVTQAGTTPKVLLVCRSDMRGLSSAQAALTQWASGAAPTVELLGLAVLADAPGKTPKPLRDFTAIIGGGAPRLWTLPWVESWRQTSAATPPAAREYQRFITDLAALATTPSNNS